ncbi:hypothetical protein C2U72_18800 [Prosthecomicrobium hirschii]|uniref:acyltransferase family protein n=1 Tax=Prosthecodimorpha hirschii TaxID=665126 RepID=UPI001126DF23|nr:acyltransferase [Prosthecomicrobium hirschii]TPQ49393.1 hypothetical protein C2U72_18800 [Prosthecomicrobium hirschii]
MAGDGGGDRLEWLDGLRGLAALAVALFWHYVHFVDPYQDSPLTIAAAPGAGLPGIGALYRHGYLAVDLFFLLSGLVFHHVYAARIAAGRIGFGTFLALRLTRLYPAHLAGFLATAVLIALAGGFGVTGAGGLAGFLGNLVLVNDGTAFNHPSWSLTVEMALYGLFFLAMRTAGPALAPPVMILAGIWIFLKTDLFILTGFARGLIGFFLAVGAAEAVRCLRSGARPSPVLVVGLAATLPFCWWIKTFAFDLVALAGIGAIAALAPLRRLASAAPLRGLGAISLAVYMVHLPIQLVLIWLWQGIGSVPPADRVWFWALYAGSVLAIATAFHRTCEVPLREALRRRLLAGRRSDGGPAPVSVAAVPAPSLPRGRAAEG